MIYSNWTHGLGYAGLLLTLLASAPAGGHGYQQVALPPRAVTVNTADDAEAPPPGAVTLRAALAAVRPGGRITFDPSLNGQSILLTQIGETNTTLVGESFPAGVFAGFVERDYGRSALVVRKNVTLDASALPLGVTLRWAGDPATPARVLAVRGNVTLRNITVTGGRAMAESRADSTQPFTLARGGGLAVWGIATLVSCTFYDNAVMGDSLGSRDRGAFGGAIYGNRLILVDCLIAGNTAIGFGAAGGGIYSVGGASESSQETAGGAFFFNIGSAGGSSLTRCVISGNLVQGQHAYGGGVYSDGGGSGNSKTILLANCTVARNRACDNPDIPEDARAQYYCRGGGVYMSNGSMKIEACTIVENAVTGHPAVFRSRPNLGGGGIAATIGNAHVVENMSLSHSIIAGNTVNASGNDVYTGSLIHFYSYGYNLIGELDMSQMLAPVPLWKSLHRRHWPALGDLAGVAVDDVVDRAAAIADSTIRSVGVGEHTPAVLAYPPLGPARDRIPAFYKVPLVHAQWRATTGEQQPNGEVLTAIVARYRRSHPELDLPDFGDLDAIRFQAESMTWPALAENTAWLDFWRRFDAAVAGRLGPNAGLDNAFWTTFRAQPTEGPVKLRVFSTIRTVRHQKLDQMGKSRPANKPADIGAFEVH